MVNLPPFGKLKVRISNRQTVSGTVTAKEFEYKRISKQEKVEEVTE